MSSSLAPAPRWTPATIMRFAWSMLVAAIFLLLNVSPLLSGATMQRWAPWVPQLREFVAALFYRNYLF